MNRIAHTQSGGEVSVRWLNPIDSEGVGMLLVTKAGRRGPQDTVYRVRLLVADLDEAGGPQLIGLRLQKSDGQGYDVVALDGCPSCECWDWLARHQGKGSECKHLKAARLALQKLVGEV